MSSSGGLLLSRLALGLGPLVSSAEALRQWLEWAERRDFEGRADVPGLHPSSQDTEAGSQAAAGGGSTGGDMELLAQAPGHLPALCRCPVLLKQKGTQGLGPTERLSSLKWVFL